MKKIIITILVLISVQSFGQMSFYGIKCNTNGSVDSIKKKDFTDSLFINDVFIQFSKEHFSGYFEPVYPNGFENYIQRADGKWIHTNCLVNNATIVPVTTQAAIDLKANISHTHTISQLSNASTVGANLLGLSTPASPSLIRVNTNGTTVSRTVAEAKADLSIENVDNTSDANKPISTATQTALNAKQATLVSGSNIKTVNGTSLLGSTDILTTRKVAQADIAATASATPTTTLFTPAVDGFYRIGCYMKLTVTGTSPVAGPVTITYTSADGSVAQSHVMLLRSVTGTVVTTTVNNSTTTGTVNGDIVIYAKAGVAIQYAIAVSGTFGAGRYVAHLICEQL